MDIFKQGRLLFANLLIMGFHRTQVVSILKDFVGDPTTIQTDSQRDNQCLYPMEARPYIWVLSMSACMNISLFSFVFSN